MRLYYDIETGAAPDAAEQIRRLKPFRPEEVKVGNLKDPSKIAEKIAEAEQAHYADLLDKAALDPRFARVVAFGAVPSQMSVAPSKMTIASTLGDEAELLRYIWSWFDISLGYRQLCGWNSHKFDLPFLVRRSWALRVPVPTTIVGERGYLAHHIDLMKVWCLNQYGEFAGLKATAEFLGVSQPRTHRVEGKYFWEIFQIDPDAALQYLEDDIIETRAVGEIIL